MIRLAVTGPGGFHVQREAAILVRPSRGGTIDGRRRRVGAGRRNAAGPGARPHAARHGEGLDGVGGAVRYDVAALVRALDDYPLLCLEQASSKGLPLAVLPDGPRAGPRAARLQQAVGTVLDKQRFDGGFGLWSATRRGRDLALGLRDRVPAACPQRRCSRAG